MLIGIDLLWVRPSACGGTESYIRNLMHGFGQYDRSNQYILFTTRDNTDTFTEYADYPNMTIHTCQVDYKVQAKRILWENLFLHKEARKQKVDLMFIPVYSKPRSKKDIPYVCVVHDLQPMHFPQYYAKSRYQFFLHAWKSTCKTADLVIAISNHCREDLIAHYPYVKDRIKTLYNPICKGTGTIEDEESVLNKYGIKEGEFDYCVSSLLYHKNLDTILKVMKERKKTGDLEHKLVLSGVGGDNQAFLQKIKDLDIEDMVIQTGFVSNEERDLLYRTCRLFLFPSVFEGFGMPPIEAMRLGKRVVMTKETCLLEVTGGKATYVDEPYSVEDWMNKIETALEKPEVVEPFHQYDLEVTAKKYIETFEEVVKR